MSLFQIKSSTRIAISIGCIAASIVWTGLGLGILPDNAGNDHQTEKRTEFCKTLAITSKAISEAGRVSAIGSVLDEFCDANPDVVSAALRTENGTVLAQVGAHQKHWTLAPESKSTIDQMRIAITNNSQPWAQLEIRFREPFPPTGIRQYVSNSLLLILFCGGGVTLVTWFYLGRILKHLNPSNVVPSRVRSALDTLAEGLLLIDPDGTIVMANLAFANKFHEDSETLAGEPADKFPWRAEDGELPWVTCWNEKAPQHSRVVSLMDDHRQSRKFIVNATPVFGDRGDCRGVLASFEDVTALENKKDELSKMLNVLKASRDEIQRQNHELQVLANVDPLSGCLNRRAFFEKFASHWESAAEVSLAVIMTDIDHFKSVNDTYGHSTGDDVIRSTGGLLKKVIGDQGLVCRYGGEEFCILIPGMPFEKVAEIAEQINVEIGETPVGELSVTVSVGVSSNEFGAMDEQHLLDQADQCLYVAKRTGRNRVVRWDNCPKQPPASEESRESGEKTEVQVNRVLQQATVNALVSALAYRHFETAAHSRRVANLAVEVGRHFLDSEELLTLENAALLHDLGKIGVPDKVLLKTGALTTDEWKVMHQYHEISSQLTQVALANDQVASLIRFHHFPFRHNQNISQQLSDLPVSARIITVCDAFDSMIHDRVDRKRLQPKVAFEKLKHASGIQFDPLIVDALELVLQEYPDCAHCKPLPELFSQQSHDLEFYNRSINRCIIRHEFEPIEGLVQQLLETIRDEPIFRRSTAVCGHLVKAIRDGDTNPNRLFAYTTELAQIEANRTESANHSQADHANR